MVLTKTTGSALANEGRVLEEGKTYARGYRTIESYDGQMVLRYVNISKRGEVRPNVCGFALIVHCDESGQTGHYLLKNKGYRSIQLESDNVKGSADVVESIRKMEPTLVRGKETPSNVLLTTIVGGIK